MLITLVNLQFRGVGSVEVFNSIHVQIIVCEHLSLVEVHFLVYLSAVQVKVEIVAVLCVDLPHLPVVAEGQVVDFVRKV